MKFNELNTQFIPLKPNSKVPDGAFKGKTFDTDYLVQHYHKGGNIGLLSQPDLIFIDIDTHKGIDGLAVFKQWLSDKGLNADQIINGTMSQVTPTGGIHLIYKRPEGLTFIQDIGFLPNVDIKASANNYIVFYPSKIDGVAYRLRNEGNTEVLTLPTELAEALKEQPQGNNTECHTEPNTATQGDALNYLSTRYGDKLDPFWNVLHGWGGEGQRNVVIFKWAQRMRNITDYDTALVFADLANNHSEEPYPQVELENTIRSAYEFGREPKPETYTEPVVYQQFRTNSK